MVILKDINITILNLIKGSNTDWGKAHKGLSW